MNDWIKAKLTRDSVCAADDANGLHEIAIILHPDKPIRRLVEIILEIRYLPEISGGQATWLVKANNVNIAIIAQQWKSAKYFIDTDMLLSDFYGFDDVLEIDIKYYVQKDPDKVYNEIINGGVPSRW